MQNHSNSKEEIATPLDHQFEKWHNEQETKKQIQSAGAWTDKQRSKETKAKRIKRALNNFWYFDRTYFDPSTDHAKPGMIHEQMFEDATSGKKALYLHASGRDFAKTAYLKKIRVWQCLRGDMSVGGVFAHDLLPARNYINGIELLLTKNPKITEDFEIKTIKSNEDIFSFSIKGNKKLCTILPFSLGRTAKGTQIGISRLDFLDFDDVENSSSNFTKKAVYDRIDKVDESFRSGTQRMSSLFLTNTEHHKCMFISIKKDLAEGLDKHDGYILREWVAWSFKKTKEHPYKGSAWSARYPATSEKEMQILLGAKDSYRWAQYQIDPKQRFTDLFPPEHYQEYDPKDLPSDVRGVAYCDQNLSLEGKGDSTCLGALLYSPSLDRFYAQGIRCKSYKDSNDLYNDYFNLLSDRITVFGMDGHVSQASHWTNHLRSWSLRNKRPSPYTEFKNYITDNLIEGAKSIYQSKRVYFPKGFKETEEGERFFEQLHSFEGKKANRPDDAPDWFICCYFFGLEMNRYTPSSGASDYAISSFAPSGY